jgi:hypothetical protein
MDLYLRAFEVIWDANVRLYSQLGRALNDQLDPELIASILKDDELRAAFRYIAAPPISEDDLETLIDGRLAWTQIKNDADRAMRIREVMRAVLDPKRFPWIAETRQPTPAEAHAAALASSVAAASQRVQTSRRLDEKKLLEGAVLDTLEQMGLKRSTPPRRKVESLRRDAPKPGEFYGACVVGEDGADAVIGLFDHRVMAIECKASNSEINSRKRINKEICQDAQNWFSRFGRDEFIPAAAIQGVFNPAYLAAAQNLGVGIFWSHRLQDLRRFIASTRSGASR